ESETERECERERKRESERERERKIQIGIKISTKFQTDTCHRNRAGVLHLFSATCWSCSTWHPFSPSAGEARRSSSQFTGAFPPEWRCDRQTDAKCGCAGRKCALSSPPPCHSA